MAPYTHNPSNHSYYDRIDSLTRDRDITTRIDLEKIHVKYETEIDNLTQKLNNLHDLLIESSLLNVESGFQASMSSKLREWFVATRREIIIGNLIHDISKLGEFLQDEINRDKPMADLADDVKAINEHFTLYYILVASLSDNFETIESAANDFYEQHKDQLNKEYLAKMSTVSDD